MIRAERSGANGSGDCIGGIVEAVDKVKNEREDDNGKNQILEFKQLNHSCY